MRPADRPICHYLLSECAESRLRVLVRSDVLDERRDFFTSFRMTSLRAFSARLPVCPFARLLVQRAVGGLTYEAPQCRCYTRIHEG